MMKGMLLVVDDEATIRLIIARELSARGYECDVADRVISAQKKLRARKYDVLISDTNMPHSGHSSEGGMELLQWARKRRPDMAILMITGCPTVDSAVEALRLGAVDYMPKPLDLKSLCRKVDRIRELQKFLNPRGILNLYTNLMRDVLETESDNNPEVESKVNQVRSRFDHLFHALRLMEQTLLDQRLRLAEIASCAEEACDHIVADDLARAALEGITPKASYRL
jgi:DNA-binding NtrC family response regulator